MGKQSKRTRCGRVAIVSAIAALAAAGSASAALQALPPGQQVNNDPAAGIDPLRPLSEMGMDSLMAVELRLALESRLRVDLPLVSLAEGTSVASIAARLSAAISAGPKDGEQIALVARHESAAAGLVLTSDLAAEDKSIAAAE